MHPRAHSPEEMQLFSDVETVSGEVMVADALQTFEKESLKTYEDMGVRLATKLIEDSPVHDGGVMSGQLMQSAPLPALLSVPA